jgi:hypothetical protein
MTEREGKTEPIEVKGLLARDADFVRAALEAEMSEAIGPPFEPIPSSPRLVMSGAQFTAIQVVQRFIRSMAHRREIILAARIAPPVIGRARVSMTGSDPRAKLGACRVRERT